MRNAVLGMILIAAFAMPAAAADQLSVSGSVGFGANKEFMDAGVTAMDLSASLGMSLLPLQLGDLAVGVTLRATVGSSIIDDTTSAEWYALTPMLTVLLEDSAPMFVSVGYGPHAYTVLPEVYIYSPAVVAGFLSGSGFMEFGILGPTVFIGFGLLL